MERLREPHLNLKKRCLLQPRNDSWFRQYQPRHRERWHQPRAIRLRHPLSLRRVVFPQEFSLPTICSGRTIIGRTSAETPQDLTASSSHCAVLIFAPPYKPTDVESMHSSETDESLNIHVTHEGSIVTFAAISARETS